MGQNCTEQAQAQFQSPGRGIVCPSWQICMDEAECQVEKVDQEYYLRNDKCKSLEVESAFDSLQKKRSYCQYRLAREA
jgi:hypothetical protein